MLDVKHKRSYTIGMNKLDHAKRTQIIHLLVEGNSMRATARIADVAINTVVKRPRPCTGPLIYVFTPKPFMIYWLNHDIFYH